MKMRFETRRQKWVGRPGPGSDNGSVAQPGPPPATVIRAFNGSPGSLVRLPGGQDGSWRAGDVVLKQAGPDSAAPWLRPALQRMPGDPGFRLARPLSARRGNLAVE